MCDLCFSNSIFEFRFSSCSCEGAAGCIVESRILGKALSIQAHWDMQYLVLCLLPALRVQLS